MRETKEAVEGTIQAEWKLWFKEMGESLLSSVYYSLCVSGLLAPYDRGLSLLCFVKHHE